MRLLLIGCTGFIGRGLLPRLIQEGHELTIISRKKPGFLSTELKNRTVVHIQLNPSNRNQWKNEALEHALIKTDGVINLAGEPIAEKRWTNKHRMEIINSRIKTTELLTEALLKMTKPPKVLINGSAIGYYGTSPNIIFNEESPCGKDFLGELCERWEKTALNKPKSTRLMILRIGIVLGHDGGALGKMLPVFKAGLGGPIGDGKQWMSWIHRNDLCQIIATGLRNHLWTGAFNCVAPNPVSMNKFSKNLGTVLGRPTLIRVPAPILKLLLGDGAKVVLEGQNVAAEKLLKQKFKFNFPEINQALVHSIKN